MGATYVRRYYGVPAKRGMRVVTSTGPGVITSFDGQYIRVRLDDPGVHGARPLRYHPTWRMTYLGLDGKTVLASYGD